MSTEPNASTSTERRMLLAFVLSTVVGVLLVSAALQHFLEERELIQARTHLETRAHTLALLADRDIAEAQHDLEFLARAAAFRQPLLADRVAACAERHDHFGEYLDPTDGKRYLAAWVGMHSGWHLGLVRDRAALIAEIHPVVWRITALAGLLFLGISGIGVGIAHRIGKRWDAAERALGALAKRQEAILAAVPDIIMEVDCNKVYTWANRAGVEFFGEGVVGKDAAFYFEGEQQTYRKVQPLFDGDESVIYLESWQRRKDGEKRLLAWWCRVLKDAQGHVTGAFSTARDITERQRAEDEVQRAYTRASVISEVLRLSLEALPLDRLLEKALDSVLAVSDLAIERRGAVFLVEDAPDILVLKASRGLAEPLLTACVRVPFGKCLCGQAAASGQVEFADCLDKRHEIRYAGIHPHGHYCVPIRVGDRTIGVLDLYVQAGHTRDAGLERTLVGIADALAGVVARRQIEAQRDEHLQELRRWNAVTLGRENRVLELKREVNELLATSGQPPRYPSAGAGSDRGTSNQ